MESPIIERSGRRGGARVDDRTVPLPLLYCRPMHKSFADWYRAAGVEPSTDLLTKRWTAIEGFMEAATTGSVLDTVRLFHGLPSRSEGFDAAFREPFKAADAAFAMSGNDLEVSLLAGSVAGAIIEQGGSRRADVTALAMVCADYSGSRRMESFPFFVDRARQYLLERSAALRAMAREVELNAPDLGKATKHYMVTYTPEGRIELQPRGTIDAAAAGETMREALAALSAFGESAAGAVGALNQRLKLLAEECDIFWWAFSGFSRELQRSFDDIEASAAPLIAAKELAALVTVPPGPVSARAILDRVLRGAGTGTRMRVTLADAIQQAPGDWLAVWSASDIVALHGDLCPTLIAAQRASEVRTPDAWVEAVEELTGISTRIVRDPIDLALQSYYEHLLVSVIPARA